jgi:DNA mismatch repair protein MutH
MERVEAQKRLSQIVGNDLRVLAEKYHVTVFRDEKKNKGWAGHVIERHLGLPLNSSQSPNFGSWELKVISLKRLKSGILTIKETMAITMIDQFNVVQTEFENSHLRLKMEKILIAARIWEDKNESSSVLQGIYQFDLSNVEIYNQIKEDYNLVQETIKRNGFKFLTGKMGVYIQPRTKGPGHGSVSRAFYARTSFLKKIINL